MPSSVSELFAAAGEKSPQHVAWGVLPELDRPGVYVLSLEPDADGPVRADTECHVDDEALERWLQVRPELRLDGHRPSASELAGRLRGFWLPDEVVVYIGLAGTSVRRRVGQYYRTPLGARRPHAGGHFIKTLENVASLWVHYAAVNDPEAAERAMLAAFVAGASGRARSVLLDPTLPIPFANLEFPRGRRKRHGVTGSTGDVTPADRPPRRATGRPGTDSAHSALSSSFRPTLHDEIVRILQERPGQWMTTAEIAAAVVASGNYLKRDGSAVGAFQIHGRTRNYPHLFERDGSRVRLRLGD